MKAPLMKIYITPEDILPGEPAMVERVLDCGWDYVHLRHPGASLRDMRNLIEAIGQRYHGRLRLHGHFILASEFNLGGLHLNRRCMEVPPFYSGPVSRSCHSVEEVRRSKGCDYVTLSPVFDSISKPGYRAAFSTGELVSLNEIAEPGVIALGGVRPDRIKEIEKYNFRGFAVKGGIDLFI